MEKIFKVGVIINSFQMSKFERDVIEKLDNSNLNIRLYAILEENLKENPINFFIRKINQHGILRLLELFFFKSFCFLEEKLLRFFNPEIVGLKSNFLLNKKIFYKIINVKPKFSKFRIFSDYSEKDKDLITKENLDIVLRGNVYEIFKSNKLNIAKYGVISFHHGDPIWNKGGPAGFWETYFNKPETGFIIQILNKNLDNGNIVFKGELATKRLYTLNKYNLLRESNNYLINVIEKILINQKTTFIQLNVENTIILKTPNIFILIKYLIRKFLLITNLFIKKYIQNKKNIWQVGYARKDFNKVDFKNTKKIKNLKNRYFADPFVINENSKDFIFVEDFNYKTKKGSISVIEIDQEDNQKIYEKIINENFHMSFPFIFKYKDVYYLIPETQETKSIRLYKCKNFPDKWEYSHDLISNINCVDSMVFLFKDKYYLITTKSDYDDYSSQLYIYESNSPISKIWKPHNLNPVYFDLSNGRNGGLIKIKNKNFRVVQKFGINQYGDNQYGNEIGIKHIENLNLDILEEKFLFNVKPNFQPNLTGIHHLSGIDNFTVFDYSYYD